MTAELSQTAYPQRGASSGTRVANFADGEMIVVRALRRTLRDY
jgi:hypothetical protein